MNHLLLIILQANILEKSVDIVQKVDSFYNNAWDKLIIVITIGFTIVGIIVPLFIQWLQKRTLKASEELLKTEISNKTLDAKNVLKEELLKTIIDKFKTYEKEIEKTREAGKAKALFAEGKYNLEKNNFDGALGDFINSAYACIKSDDHKTLQNVVKNIYENCLPFLSFEEIEDLKISNNGDLLAFLDHLTNNDDRGIFQEMVGNIKVKITKIPKKVKDKPSEKSKKVEN